MKKQGGFTLMELIIVIVILGILAAFAIPKYVGLEHDARAASAKGLLGGITAAAETIHGAALAKGNTAGAAVNVGGVVVNLCTNLYPTATNDGIGNAISGSLTGFTVTTGGSTITYTATGANNTSQCYVSYTVSNSVSYPTYANGILDSNNC